MQIRAGVPGEDLRRVWPFCSVLFMSKREGRKSITVTIKMLELLGRQDSAPDLAALPTRSSTSFDPTRNQLILAAADHLGSVWRLQMYRVPQVAGWKGN